MQCIIWKLQDLIDPALDRPGHDAIRNRGGL